MAYIQGAANSDGFNNILSVTLSSDVTAGSTVIAVWVTGGSQPDTVTTSGSGTFTDFTTGTAGGGAFAGSALLKNAASGPHTITLTMPGPNSLRMVAVEYGGLTTFDVASTLADGYGSSAVGNNATPAASGETAIGIVHAIGSGTTLSSWLSSLSEDVELVANAHTFGFASIASAGAGAINAGATLSASGSWTAWILFLSGGGGGASIVPLAAHQYRQRRA